MSGREGIIVKDDPFLLEPVIRKKYEKCSSRIGFSVRISPDLVFDLYRIWCSIFTGFYSQGKTAEEDMDIFKVMDNPKEIVDYIKKFVIL